MKDGEGQILLLSALVACACIIMLSTYLYSVSAAVTTEYRGLERATLDNVLWAQDLGLYQAAAETGSCHWGQREELATTFESKVDKQVNSTGKNMLDHGIAYSFAFNDTLADEYLEDNTVTDMENVDGILLKKDGSNAEVCGCAYDVMLSDGSSQFSVSRVKMWD